MRITHAPSVWCDTETTPIDRIFYFRTQQLLDLYINEIEGQISDGCWENSNHTEWVWKGKTLYLLGDSTKLISISQYYGPRKKSFHLNKQLCDIVGERATEEAGFNTLGEMRQAWQEVANAISKAADHYGVSDELYDRYYRKPKERYESQRKLVWEQTKENIQGLKRVMVEKTYSSERLVALDEEGKRCFFIELTPTQHNASKVIVAVRPYIDASFKTKYCVPISELDEHIDTLIRVSKAYGDTIDAAKEKYNNWQ